jgi:hypothetical protein
MKSNGGILSAAFSALQLKTLVALRFMICLKYATHLLVEYFSEKCNLPSS